jgi:hypothetical protein
MRLKAKLRKLQALIAHGGEPSVHRNADFGHGLLKVMAFAALPWLLFRAARRIKSEMRFEKIANQARGIRVSSLLRIALIGLLSVGSNRARHRTKERASKKDTNSKSDHST